GVCRPQILPGEPGRVPTGLAEEIRTAGHLDELGNPVAGRHQRREPFDRGHARTRSNRSCPSRDLLRLRTQLRGEFPSSLRRPEAVRHPLYVPPYPLEARRIERDEKRPRCRPPSESLLDLREADRADLALNLRHDMRRRKLAQTFRIDAVDGEAAPDEIFHARVDFSCRDRGVDLRRRTNGDSLDTFWKVALVRTPHQRLLKAERCDDLGRAREKRDDPKRRQSGSCRHFSSARASLVSVRRSAKTNPSLSRTSPGRTKMGERNIGPAVTHVWNSPFSPQGSTEPGTSSTNPAPNEPPP